MNARRLLPMVIVAAYAALTVGSTAGLCWLAPLEYATGRWLGLAAGLAAVVPSLIDSYVVLSVLTARDRKYALPIAGLSGGIGQLHAAGVLPSTSVTVRGWVATVAVLLAVAVTARLKPLVAVVVRAYRDEASAAAHDVAAREAAQLEAVRAHEAEIVRLEDAAREAAHRRAQEVAEAAHRRDLERTQASHESAARPRTATPAARRTGLRTAGARKGAQAPAQADDLQRRRAAEEAYKASVRSGGAMDAGALARILCGVEKPDSAQRAKARARASEWRRAVVDEGALIVDEVAR